MGGLRQGKPVVDLAVIHVRLLLDAGESDKYTSGAREWKISFILLASPQQVLGKG